MVNRGDANINKSEYLQEKWNEGSLSFLPPSGKTRSIGIYCNRIGMVNMNVSTVKHDREDDEGSARREYDKQGKTIENITFHYEIGGNWAEEALSGSKEKSVKCAQIN